MRFKSISYSTPWNLFLIVVGCLIVSAGLNLVVLPHNMITGGFSGAGILLYYYTKIFSPGIWYFIINIPVMIIGWLLVSKRFFFYSLFGSVFFSIAIDLIKVEIEIQDPMLATIAGGAIIGVGAGIIYRSLGSAGGNDVIAIFLNQKFGVRIGTYHFAFNFLLFVFSFGILNTDLILYSISMSYITALVIDSCTTLFNQRKLILIVSNKSHEIAQSIMAKQRRGVTFLKGEGAYSKQAQNIIMTIANGFQIKRIEEIAFSIDSDAFFITENTFSVIGKGFSKRKIY